jgi:glycosyltransferase involved in cell wall biosynthesis
MNLSVSVVICCHNSARLLPNTLAHLKRQRVSAAIDWEVLIIDNASTDNTASVAERVWDDNGLAPLRVVREDRLGLSYARERAFEEARFEIVCFVDDDNWINPDWVRKVSEAFGKDSDLAATGSLVYPAFETAPAGWWYDYGVDYFALTGEPSNAPWFIKGAGMAIRREAWQALRQLGFTSRLVDRSGETLSGGGDTELTTALRLNGWKLAILPELRVRHFMPNRRLEWTYLRKLVRGYSTAHVLLDAYTEHSMTLGSPRCYVSDQWWYQLARTLKVLISRPQLLFAGLFSNKQGHLDTIECEKLIGRILGLLKLRRRYGFSRRIVRAARWRMRKFDSQAPSSDGMPSATCETS